MSTTAETANNPKAHDLLKAAHERAWRFPEAFKGLKADITVESTGENTIHGTLTIAGPQDADLQIKASEDVTKWTNQQVASMIGHR